MTAPTEKNDPNQPNEYGFAGGATGPTPQPDRGEDDRAERTAVPADDLATPVASAMDPEPTD